MIRPDIFQLLSALTGSDTSLDDISMDDLDDLDFTSADLVDDIDFSWLMPCRF